MGNNKDLFTGKTLPPREKNNYFLQTRQEIVGEMEYQDLCCNTPHTFI